MAFRRCDGVYGLLKQDLVSNTITSQKSLTQTSFCRESLIADIAAERLLPGMNSHVIPECAVEVEFFATLGTRSYINCKELVFRE